MEYSTWHISYNCTGVHYYEFAHLDMLKPCLAYDDVKLNELFRAQKQASQKIKHFNISQSIKGITES
jgi:hypothetical protein